MLTHKSDGCGSLVLYIEVGRELVQVLYKTSDGDHKVNLARTTVLQMTGPYRQGGGGFEGVRSNPPFGLQKFYMHRLTVHVERLTV